MTLQNNYCLACQLKGDVEDGLSVQFSWVCAWRVHHCADHTVHCRIFYFPQKFYKKCW